MALYLQETVQQGEAAIFSIERNGSALCRAEDKGQYFQCTSSMGQLGQETQEETHRQWKGNEQRPKHERFYSMDLERQSVREEICEK